MGNAIKKKWAWALCLMVIVFLLVLELISLVIPGSGVLDKLCTLFCMSACIYGLIYAYSGYKKKAAENYQLFMLLYALFCIISTINIYTKGDDTINLVNILVSAISAVLILIIAFAKNLGKDLSFNLSVGALVLFIISGIITIGNTNNTFSTIIVAVQGIALALMALLFVSAKYKDKDSRGTL